MLARLSGLGYYALVPVIASDIPESVSAYMAKIGRIGGRKMSPRKLKAVRRNAKLGGRPKKTTQPHDPNSFSTDAKPV